MTGRPSPFLVVSWRTDFLRTLLRLALEETEGNIAGAEFIFPHSRPKRYLSLLLAREKSLRRPLLMPKMRTVSGLFAGFSGRILSRPAWNAGLLDRVGLLLTCVREEAGQEEALFLADARRFFPWGVRLAALFEECFSQHRKPANFPHAEVEVSPFAAGLLSRLGHIYARYETALREREWTSPGFDAWLTAEYLAAGDPLPDGIFSRNNRIYIAGFHILNRAENALFRRLWEEAGARVVLHADPALAGGGAVAHWSCRFFSDWAKEWRADLQAYPALAPAEAPAEQRIRCYAGFDLHSQLAMLDKELPDAGFGFSPESGPPKDDTLAPDRPDPDDRMADTVIVLPDSGLLMPALHHLPRADVNISMGYPLSRSPLFRLVETLLRLQEGRKPGGYYWRDLLDLIRHPYVKMLRPAAPEIEDPVTDEAKGTLIDWGSAPNPTGDERGGGPSSPLRDESLRRELHRLEQAVRDNGRRYADPFALLREVYESLPREDLPPAPVLALLEELLDTALTGFENPSRLKDLAASLEKLCAFLTLCGRPLWRRFPIDAECLHRLRHSLIPELALSVSSAESFPPDTLFAILRDLLEAERVPFEAAPLVGLQIMGMLETRLLFFRRVLIVDAGEDSLPGLPNGDPLLPDALRPELGLPSPHSREQAAAYPFFRLLAGAEEIVLLWQEGGDAPGIQDQKKKKSRFVEELLWEEEKKLDRLLRSTGEDGPLTVLASRVTPFPRTRTGIALSPPVRKLILALQKEPVSASLLDSYLRCPARFFYERLARLAEPGDVPEGEDPLAVGNLFHRVLRDVYAGRLARPLPGGEELVRDMESELLDNLYASSDFLALSRKLPADALAMLARAAEKRLAEYLRAQPPTRVLALETPLRAAFSHQGASWVLVGTADRIDARSPSGPEQEGQAEPMREAPEEQKNRETPADEERDENEAGIVILEYKTGHVPSVSPDLWEDGELWKRMEHWRPKGEGAADTLLAELSGRMESVQLPLYLLLYSLAPPGDAPPPGAMSPPDACWIALGDKGQEIPLFPKKFSPEQRRQAVEKQIPSLVHFLLRHMLENPVLSPCPGRHCDWCSSAKLCMLPDTRQ